MPNLRNSDEMYNEIELSDYFPECFKIQIYL